MRGRPNIITNGPDPSADKAVGKAFDKTAGFSLLEMMVVLVIIALMSTIVFLNMPREKLPEQALGQKLLYEFNLAHQTSMITGRPQAFGLSRDAYIFYQFDGENWQIVRENMWADGLRIRFYRENEPLDLPKAAVPVVVFDPVGLSTAFSLEVSGQEQTINISSQGDGQMAMQTLS